jgi:hypothetical protein
LLGSSYVSGRYFSVLHFRSGVSCAISRGLRESCSHCNQSKFQSGIGNIRSAFPTTASNHQLACFVRISKHKQLKISAKELTPQKGAVPKLPFRFASHGRIGLCR